MPRAADDCQPLGGRLWLKRSASRTSPPSPARFASSAGSSNTMAVMRRVMSSAVPSADLRGWTPLCRVAVAFPANVVFLLSAHAWESRTWSHDLWDSALELAIVEESLAARALVAFVDTLVLHERDHELWLELLGVLAEQEKPAQRRSEGATIVGNDAERAKSVGRRDGVAKGSRAARLDVFEKGQDDTIIKISQRRCRHGLFVERGLAPAAQI